MKISETLRITGAHVGEVGGLQLVDPRTDESAKIYFERKGSFVANERVYTGSYIVYNTPTMQKSYAGVFVAENLDEDSDQQQVNLIAIDPSRKAVVNRTRYRARVSERKIQEMHLEGR